MAIAVALLANMAPAAAGPLERVRFNQHVETAHADFCGASGLMVLEVLDADVNLMVIARGKGRLPSFQSTAHGSFTWTNQENHKTVTSVFNIVDKDQLVTDNGDGTLTVIVKSAGGERWYGPDGRLLYREPGQVRYELLVDHAGTPDDPFDDEVIEFVGIVKGSTGRNDLQQIDFCEEMISLLS